MINFLRFFQANDSVLGIDIGSSSIKVVQLKRKGGRAFLETYGELALGPYGNVEVGRGTNLTSAVTAKALTSIMKEANVTTTRAGMAIPVGSSLVSIIEMPMADENQLATMVPFEARKYIPVPITEVTLDWSLIPREDNSRLVEASGGGESSNGNNGSGGGMGGGAAARTAAETMMGGGQAMQVGASGMPLPGLQPLKTEVLVVAILNTVLQKYQEIVTATALDSTFFELEVFSALRSIAGTELAPMLVIDFGAASTKVYIIDRGVIRDSHTIGRGSQDLTLALSKSMSMTVDQAEDTKRRVGLGPSTEHPEVRDTLLTNLNYIMSESEQVMLKYQRKYNKNISKVILTGGGALLKGLDALTRETFKTDVFLADPFSKVESPLFLHDILKEIGPSFAVALGTAIRKLQESSI